MRKEKQKLDENFLLRNSDLNIKPQIEKQVLS